MPAGTRHKETRSIRMKMARCSEPFHGTSRAGSRITVHGVPGVRESVAFQGLTSAKP